MTKTYTDIPTLKQWQQDSSVALANRSKDTLLRSIDTVVLAYERAKDAAEQQYVLCELFFRIDYWLRTLDRGNPVLNKKREPVVHALYKYVVDRLCTLCGVTVNVLPRELESCFGRELSDHGSKLDQEWDCAQYLSRAEVKKYRLWWRKGRAYQFPWWKPKARPGVSRDLAESARAYAPGITDAGYGGFAMSMGRDIYMAKHHCRAGFGKLGNHYHSSYLGGEAVLCAGTLVIKKGIVHRIRTDSGHYQPTDEHLLNVLHTLTMVGAPIGQIRVESYDGRFSTKAVDFKSHRANWSSLLKRRQANLSHRHAQIHSKNMDKWLFDVWNYYRDETAALTYIRSETGWPWKHAQDKLYHAWERYDIRRQIRADRAKKFGKKP